MSEDKALSEASMQYLGTQLAVLTAMEKVVKERKGDIRFEAEQRLRELNDETGADSVAMKVGDEKVGKLSLTGPRVGVSDPNTYAKWAWENGMGRRRLVVDLDQSDLSDAEIVDRLGSQLHDAIGGNYVRVEYEADDIAKRDLQPRMGSVLSKATGELVPGTYVKAGYVRVTGCKPADVGEAMARMGGGPTVAGLLTGGE